MARTEAQRQAARATATKKRVANETAKVKEAREKQRSANESLEVTDVGTWKKQSEGIKLQLPSGNVCLAKNVGLEVFLIEGAVPNDLMPIVEKAVNEGKGISAKKSAEMASDPELLKQMIRLANVVVTKSVIQPPVRMDEYTEEDVREGACAPDLVGKKIPLTERSDDILYIDDVDFDDKTFIFQWVVGGTRDLHTFREQQAASLEAVSALEADEQEA